MQIFGNMLGNMREYQRPSGEHYERISGNIRNIGQLFGNMLGNMREYQRLSGEHYERISGNMMGISGKCWGICSGILWNISDDRGRTMSEYQGILGITRPSAAGPI
jgi:hypothetical protein